MEAASLTIQEIIRRPLFQGAVVFANETALERVVKWAHVMEVTEVGHLLSGQELILCTGIGWQDDEAKSASFLEQLIRSNASGLCVELGTYAKKPLEQMKRIAMDANFPLIFFYHEVRYIDITRDLHTHLINEQHQISSQLTQLDKRLNELALSGKGLTALLGELRKTVHAQVIYRRVDGGDGQPYFDPPVPNRKLAASLIDQTFEASEGTDMRKGKPTTRIGESSRFTLQQPVIVMNRVFAEIALHAEQPLGRFERSALERCASAVAHELLRTLYNEEKQRTTEHHWVTDWLQGKRSTRDISGLAAAVPGFRANCPKVVIVMEASSAALGLPDFGGALLHFNLLARRRYDKAGFTLLPAMLGQQVIYVVFARKHIPAMAETVRSLADDLRSQDASEQPSLFEPLYGIGSIFYEPEGLLASYEAAKETLAVRQTSGIVDSPLHDELHIYRMIHNMRQDEVFQHFCAQYVTPLLHYDNEHDGQLMLTLKTLLQHAGSKKAAAEALFVVRQTLYHRIEKLKELLGPDFMEPHKRVAIELALHVHDYNQRRF